jgi:rhodanese-related sulfurtransferase
MADLSQQNWREQLQNDDQAVIIDVRTADEVAEGMIEGARHIDIFGGPAFIHAVEQLDPNKSYYVYCRSGNRSGQACALMNAKGIARAYNLLGGVMSWEGPLV